MPANVVVLGCGRSGTSIFGELFEDLPGYTYRSEPTLDELRALDRSGPIAVKVPKAGPDEVLPAGSPVDLATLFELVPVPRVVFWQVRHPLDAICSLRPGISNNWAHHPRPPDWRDWQGRPLLERCAHHWAVINEAGYEQVRSVAMVNRFEDMIGDPTECASKAARAVGLDPDECADAIRGWAQRVRDTNDEHFVEAVTSRSLSRPDHVRRVGRWQENLTAEEIELVRPIVAAAAATFAYEIPLGA